MRAEEGEHMFLDFERKHSALQYECPFPIENHTFQVIRGYVRYKSLCGWGGGEDGGSAAHR